MFTDGKTTAGAPPAPVAAAARAQGIVIYCIGLLGSDGVDVNALNDWATDPDASHVAVTPDAAELEELFAELAANISKTGATNIVINETVTADFVITSILTPSAGSATMLNATSLRWTIPQLGVSSPESAALEFFIRHVGQNPGTKLVNESITYSDTEGNVVDFPEPTVSVECDVVVNPEECPCLLYTSLRNSRPGLWRPSPTSSPSGRRDRRSLHPFPQVLQALCRSPGHKSKLTGVSLCRLQQI